MAAEKISTEPEFAGSGSKIRKSERATDFGHFLKIVEQITHMALKCLLNFHKNFMEKTYFHHIIIKWLRDQKKAASLCHNKKYFSDRALKNYFPYIN